MYATMTTFTVKPGMQEIAEKLADKLIPGIRGLKGFKSITFFVDPKVDEYWGFALWESKEDAAAALATTGPRLIEALSGIAKEPPTRRMFRVYGPKK